MNVMFDPGELPNLLKTLTTYCVDTLYWDRGVFVNDKQHYIWYRNHGPLQECHAQSVHSKIYGKLMQLSCGSLIHEYPWKFIS